MTTTVYAVVGMTCAHCTAAVRAELRALAGVTDVSVDLRPSQDSLVSVTSDGPLSEKTVAAAIDEAGYVLASV